MTLIELAVVLLVLTALAGLVAPYVSGTSSRAACASTEASLVAIRNAIVGSFENPGYRDDMGRLPVKISELIIQGGQNSFNPVTRKGWRGPYLFNTTSSRNLSGTNFIDTVNYVNSAIFENEPVIYDGYIKNRLPIIIQNPSVISDESDARLLSAGPNGVLETRLTDASVQPDDRALYLFATPESQPSCFGE